MVKQLSQAGQERARAYIYEHARPLERSLYAYHFEGGTRDTVFAELARFQNEDGGFGNALESDMRLPDSSALATTTALQILTALEAGADHPLVQLAMRYLVDCYDADNQVWPIIPPNVDDAPHAPWWTYRPDPAAHLSNPRPEVLSYGFTYPGLMPADLRDGLVEPVLVHFEAQPDCWEGHDDLACYVRLAENPAVPAAIRTRLLRKLEQAVACTVERDPAAWAAYSCKPLKLIHGPDSVFAAALADAVAANLDYEIAHQQADGSWLPNWHWAGLYPEAWPTAAQEWAGVLTLEHLLTLRRFDRLA
jgi:hypothetical protein